MALRIAGFALALLLARGLASAAEPPATAAEPSDPLPSWNEGAAKQAILDFVRRTTSKDTKDYVAPDDRIAVFDNDGTLWCEQPLYNQFAFAIDRVKAQADRHPKWKDQEPFSFVLKGDMPGLIASGEKGLLQIIAATHAGMTTDEFHATVLEWMKTARHPRFKRPYNELAYQPMLELLAYLRASGFKTFIVSGGGIDFMRPWTEQTYGIPPEQVVGSSGKLKYEIRDGQPVLVKLPEVNFIDDKAGKPIGIEQFIGRRPIAAFGNSDGDYEMLRWTTADSAPGKPRLGLVVHHTDAEREYAYDQESPIGRLARALDEAQERGWIVVSMKDAWKTIFP
jgi:phosphoglycolate phosphatase-like HAD superfamily hydrolase